MGENVTGLKGLLMTARSKMGPSKKEDINLPDESIRTMNNPPKKKKTLMDRFVDSRPEADKAAINHIRGLMKKK